MKMEKTIANRLIRNTFLSLFIYSLPVLLMLLTFYITGEKPWLKKVHDKPRVVYQR